MSFIERCGVKGWIIYPERKRHAAAALCKHSHVSVFFFASKIHLDKVQHILQRGSLLQQESKVQQLRRRQDRSIMLLLSFLINVLQPHRSKSVEVLVSGSGQRCRKPSVWTLFAMILLLTAQKPETKMYFYLIFVAIFLFLLPCVNIKNLKMNK